MLSRPDGTLVIKHALELWRRDHPELDTITHGADYTTHVTVSLSRVCEPDVEWTGTLHVPMEEQLHTAIDDVKAQLELGLEQLSEAESGACGLIELGARIADSALLSREWPAGISLAVYFQGVPFKPTVVVFYVRPDGTRKLREVYLSVMPDADATNVTPSPAEILAIYIAALSLRESWFPQN